jgi:hypothetical protein
MNIRKPKTLEDFPKFEVAKVLRGETSRTGYTKFELEGRFDRVIENIDPHWFWLLNQQDNSLCVTLISLNKETGIAVLNCDSIDAPDVEGCALFYLSPYWQAENVWMILDPNWGWNKRQFEGSNAIASNYEAKEVSIVDGREVKIWTKLEPIDGGRGQSRHYPASDQNSPPDAETRVVPGGWGHEHCTLCKEHIESGEFGYRDPGENWMCEKCHERYVVPRDLSFVDEL